MMPPMHDPEKTQMAAVWSMVIRSLLLQHRDELVKEFPQLKQGFDAIYGGGNMLTLRLIGSTKVMHLYIVVPKE